jgi:hypothetical protein
LTSNNSAKVLFPKTPILRFKPKEESCCGKKTVILKTRMPTVATLEIGVFKAHETQLLCKRCGQIYFPEDLRKFVPDQCKFGLDVIVHVGRALFLRHLNERKIQTELNDRNVPISIREIGYLGKKFIVYLALAHREGREGIKEHMSSRGGYVLHLDGTCEGDSPHLMSALDEITDIVLENVKLPSENSDRIIPFLQQIQKAYGDPIALVHDMGSGILNSVKKVFPTVPDYICHFHFLRDIGIDLFGIENIMLRKSIKGYKIKARLRKDARELEKHIAETPELTNGLNTYLKSEKLEKPEINLRPIVTAYLLIKWILESDCELNGFGFPFDRAHLVFYQRLQQAHPGIVNMKNRLRHNDILSRSANALSKIVNDQTLQKTVLKMQKKVRVFDQLREAMRVALPESKKGLNDDGEKDFDMQTIEKRVTQLRESDELNQLISTDISYKKMVKQLDKYWKKLFADPIQVNTPAGIISIQPQRTNNILERFFRELKRGYRKRSGNRSLSKAIKAMIADTPLVKNLENPDYMKIILNGKCTLEERFAEIDIKLIRQELKEKQKQIGDIPTRMKKIYKIRNLPKKLIKHTRTKIADI